MKLVLVFVALCPALASAQTPAAFALDEIVVTASPLPRTLFEQAQPVSVLSGERLRLQLRPTLGETLAGTPGVSSTYFGPAASRPIIRGLEGDRIRVLQNGSNTLDASATSADHAVSFDPVSAESIEVVRGPATLLFGPNAIGGVVNVIDRRVPDRRIDAPLRGSLEGSYGSADAGRNGAFTLEGGVRGFNWHLEGYKRATEELRIPGFARSDRLRRLEPLPEGESEARDILPNSDLRTEGLSGGASYVWDDGFFGLAYSGFHTNYGTVAEREVTIDLEQRRWDFRGAFFRPHTWIREVNYSVGISDYEHTEFEGALTGTRFENEGCDGRVEVKHESIGPLEGAFGFQSEKSNFSALGEEAFVPPVESRVNSVFLFEELKLDPRWRLQFGVRYDHASVESDTSPGFGAGQERTFDNASVSAGLVFTPADDWIIAANLGITQRAPTYQELFAHGPHVATHAFEIGQPDLETEKAVSLDLSLRKKQGRVTGSLSVFYNRFSDFIGQFANGETVPGEDDDLPVFVYRSTAAEFYGGEAEITVHLLGLGTISAPPPRRSLDLEFKADYVHAEDISAHQALPRIPPFRGSVGIRYGADRFSAGLEGQFAARQNRTSEFELPTDRYFLLNANLNYRLPLGTHEVDLYVRGVNLTKAEARLHTSFLKDTAPLGGRGIIVGLKATF